MDILLHMLLNLAHFLIGFYFVFFAFWNIYHWIPIISVMARKNIPHPWLILSAGIVLQFLAGFLIMIGLFVKLAALILIPGIFIAIYIFHPFWEQSGDVRRLNLIIFVGALTITLGALFLLIANTTLINLVVTS